MGKPIDLTRVYEDLRRSVPNLDLEMRDDDQVLLIPPFAALSDTSLSVATGVDIDRIRQVRGICEAIERESVRQWFSEGPSRTIIFLDIDGVLNSSRYWAESNRDLPMRQEGALDPVAIEQLNSLVAGFSAQVVLSSNWRGAGTESVRAVERMLRNRGFVYDLIDATASITPATCHLARWQEIDRWLTENRALWDHFIVIDDGGDAWSEAMTHASRGTFLQTNFQTGLTEESVNAAFAWWLGVAADAR